MAPAASSSKDDEALSSSSPSSSAPTWALECRTAVPQRKFLLDRIGGEAALELAVDDFYGRVVTDPTLSRFFDGITIERLKDHQRKFLRMAFTKVPDALDIASFMHSKHERLFLDGLDGTHFDTVAGHFVATLDSLGVGQAEIDEAVAIVGPLRPIFVDGAAKARSDQDDRKRQNERTLLSRLGGEGALHAAVDMFYDRIADDESLAPFFEGMHMEDIKAHQRKFLKMAFTSIPDGVDAAKYLHERHERLFLMGLNEEHFDAVAGHFVATLQCLGVRQKEIDEAVSIVSPLRPIFLNGSARAKMDAIEEEKKDAEERTLFERLGGDAAIDAAVDEFYARLVVDEHLNRFFVGVPLNVLKEHQRKFLRMAFTSISEGFDVEKYIFTKHYRLFAMGLNETHFDKVATHFVNALSHLNVPKSLIDEAVGNIAPLRPIFERNIKKSIAAK